MRMKSETFEYPLMIREFHLDTFGHVNNATYLEIFEEARWELITKNGYGLKECHQRMIGPIILAVDMQFKKELKNRERVMVRSHCFDYKGKICKIQQTLFNQKEEISCSALFTFGLFDMKARKLIDPTPEWLIAISMD